jgi:hypothetical protein
MVVVTVWMGEHPHSGILTEGSDGVQTIGRHAAAVHVAEGTDCDSREFKNDSFLLWRLLDRL